MEVTNGEIWQANAALQGACREPWPVKTAYYLAKLSRKLGALVRDIEPVRVGLIQRYGAPNARGLTEVAPGSAGWESFAKEFNELMGLEVEVDLAPVVLPTDAGVLLTGAVMADLLPFVTVEGA